MATIDNDETSITILKDIYTGGTARVYINKVSEEIPVIRGVRQGGPVSPKLFTAAI